MSAQTLHDDVDFVFCPDTLAEDELHRIAIAVEGVNRPVPTSLFTLSVEDARRLCDRLNRRLGHRDRTFLDRVRRPLPARRRTGYRRPRLSRPLSVGNANIPAPPFPPFEPEASEGRASARKEQREAGFLAAGRAMRRSGHVRARYRLRRHHTVRR